MSGGSGNADMEKGDKNKSDKEETSFKFSKEVKKEKTYKSNGEKIR